MKLLNSLSIRNKLLLLTGVLLFPLLYFSIVNFVNQLNDQKKLVAAFEQIKKTEHTSDLVNSIQNERVLSQAYLGSKGKKFEGDLLDARKRTDKDLFVYKRFLSDSDEDVSSSLYLTQRLEEYRHQIDLQRIDSMASSVIFSDVVLHLLNDIENTAFRIKESDLQKEVYAFRYLLHARESLGQIRTLVMRSIITGSFSNKDYGALCVQKASYERDIQDFLAESPKDVFIYYSEVIRDKTFDEVLSTIERIYESASMEIVLHTPEAWFEKTRSCMDKLSKVARYDYDNLKSSMEELLKSGRRKMVLFITTIVLLVVVSVFLAVYFIRSISQSISLLKDASEKILKGDTNISLKIHASDEIGSLARSFTMMSETMKRQAKVASEIGRGNYDVTIDVQSEHDLLGNSLKKMRNNLRNYSIRERRRTWELDFDRELNDIMRVQRNMDVLLKEIIDFISKKLNVQVGLIYMLTDDEKLKVKAAWGIDVKNISTDELSVMGSRPGLALRYDRVIKLKDVPESYFKIYSGIIRGLPSNIIWVPLVFKDFKIGVVELASIDKLSDEDVEFFKAECEKISTVLIGLRAVERTNELLAESQNQADILSAQQDTLKEVYEELLLQKNKLQASEEELKLSQEELQEKNIELQDKASQLEEQFEVLRQKNRQLEEARQSIEDNLYQLEVTSRYKSEFLANMSHELRTPLNSIMILSKLLLNSKEGITEKQKEYARIINQSGADLLRLINDVLDLSKIEAGKINAELAYTPLKDLLMEDEFTHLAKEKNIRFSTSISPEVPNRIYTDKFRVQQILKNLLSNAFKFTPPGGKVSLYVSYAGDQEEFQQESLKKSKVIAFSVKDTGIGISKKNQSLIFDAFQQEDSSTTRKYGGSGLGLSISKELASLLHGEIQVKSQKGKGSTFTLYLPELSDDSRQTNGGTSLPVKEETEELNTVKTSDSVLLIAEDDVELSNVIADVAQSKGYKTVVSYTGREAIEKALALLPGAVILDIGLPDISGWRVLEEIRKHKVLKHVPVHILSGDKSEERASNLPYVWVTQKPVDKEMLETTFSEIERFNSKALKRVLIIGQADELHEKVKDILDAGPVRLSTADTQEEAEKLIQSFKYDCIVLDFQLSGKDLSVVHTIRKDEKNFDTPVIIYTEKALSEEEESKIKELTESIITHAPHDEDRLADEVNLFLYHIKEVTSKETAKGKQIDKDLALKNKKILVVDDDIRNVYALHRVLESEGMKVVSAVDGKEAFLQLAEHKDIDLVLMDIMMPVMDGYEAIRQIRQMKEYKNIPIIAITAKAMKGDREKCINAGASDYISKPMDVEKLLSVMRVWLYENRKR